MNEVQGKARIVKASIALLLIASLAAFVSGCWPFNEAPLALFTASTLSGTAPLSVNFSAILSSDSDGIITDFEWDFGDGSSGSGESVSHTYTTAGTRTVVLRVTDDDGARATASKTITVNPADTDGGDGPGTSPTASFTATPLTGAVAPHGHVQRLGLVARGLHDHGVLLDVRRRDDRRRDDDDPHLRAVRHADVPRGAADHQLGQQQGGDNLQGPHRHRLRGDAAVERPDRELHRGAHDRDCSGRYHVRSGRLSRGDRAERSATYVWSFGDGSTWTEVTDRVVTHTYSTSLRQARASP